MAYKIILLGAGRSSVYVIDYLAETSLKEGWTFSVADMSEELLKEKCDRHPHIQQYVVKIEDKPSVEKLVSSNDLVISLLPPALHIQVAQFCLYHQKHLLTASYLSADIKKMDAEVKSKGLIFLNEIGLDPGIDHMSAMQMIHELKEKGAKIKSFKSFCGGLVAPESDDNPWHYKFSWNPRNVVLAGQGGVAKYLEGGQYKYIPYHQLFKRTESLEIEGFGTFEAYPNRDSLSYLELYGLEEVETMLRGTIRKEGYCVAWDLLIQLGLTDDGFKMENSEKLSLDHYLRSFVNGVKEQDLMGQIAKQIGIERKSQPIQKLEWLGMAGNHTAIGIPHASPAQILQSLLEEKWKLGNDDKDMVLMQHQFVYQFEGDERSIYSEMAIIGENQVHTAMAKTVGLPLAIATKNILQGKINLKGVCIPVMKEIYHPVLTELKEHGIGFKEYER